MTGSGRTQGRGSTYLAALLVAVLLVVAAKTAYDFANHKVRGARADARTATYLAEHSRPFCTFEGVWYDWENDETITLGCLEVKANSRAGSYTSATGPRANANSAISGSYDIDLDGAMKIAGKDRDGKNVKFTTLIYVEDEEYPTQMIVIAGNEKRVYIWQKTNIPDE